MQSKLGERPATLEARAKGLNLSKQTADDPANAALRTIRTEAYMFLGDAYGTKSLKAGEAHAFWRSAHDNYQRSPTSTSTSAVAISPRGEDAGDQVTVEIAKCDAALQR